MRKSSIFLFVVLALAVLLSACSTAAAAREPLQVGDPGAEPIRSLTVTGHGEVYLTPDIAYINIGVHTESSDAAEAVASNNARTERVIAALQSAGIAAEDIQTTNFSIYPQQQWDESGRPTGEITYVVDNTVRVTVRDLDGIGELLDLSVESGANSINGIQFDVEDRTAALSAARQAAVADAQFQAQELAQAAGVELGPIHSINTCTSAPPMPVFQADMGGRGLAESAAVPVSPGQMVVELNVHLIYEIR